MHTPPLPATPADPTPDTGPRRRGGPIVLLAALMATLTALFGVGLAHQAARPDLLAAALLVFGLPALWWWAGAVISWRDRTPLPRSHSVLVGVLGYDLICTCRGVAATVFFHPDRVAPAEDLALFVFMENYTSRRRAVEVRVGPHPGLGLLRLHTASLHLAAGQAAVYRMVLRPDAALPPGQHDLPVILRVRSPRGTGRRLPGVPRHLHDIWHTRFAAPFAIEPRPDAAAPVVRSDPVPPPAYVSLASVSETGPRLDALRALVREV